MAATEVEAAAAAAGIAPMTLRRVADALGVEKTKRGYSGGWDWSLPTQTTGKLIPFPGVELGEDEAP